MLGHYFSPSAVTSDLGIGGCFCPRGPGPQQCPQGSLLVFTVGCPRPTSCGLSQPLLMGRVLARDSPRTQQEQGSPVLQGCREESSAARAEVLPLALENKHRSIFVCCCRRNLQQYLDSSSLAVVLVYSACAPPGATHLGTIFRHY